MKFDLRIFQEKNLIPVSLIYPLLFIVFILISCNRKGSNEASKPEYGDNSKLFTLLSPGKTGIDFANNVVDGEKFNIFTYRNYYNGAGFLDIYVCNAGDVDPEERENELFINNGDLTFTEKAKEYNLNNDGLSIHAALFDYDMDGDLDCYILNNFFTNPSKIELYKKVREGSVVPGDKLMRNDGNTFHDVTAEAGIFSSEIGFGNGIGVADINHDNLPDIYIANDFWERDYIYINKGNGKFSEEFNSRFNYCSLSSMGGDIADINNDGNMDIFTTDMLPADNYRLQTTIAFDPFHLEDLKYRDNFYYQETRNCLHINDGTGYFQETGLLSGVSATDWSWGALIFDFENDGNKDIFISNGIIT